LIDGKGSFENRGENPSKNRSKEKLKHGKQNRIVKLIVFCHENYVYGIGNSANQNENVTDVDHPCVTSAEHE